LSFNPNERSIKIARKSRNFPHEFALGGNFSEISERRTRKTFKEKQFKKKTVGKGGEVVNGSSKKGPQGSVLASARPERKKGVRD